MRGRFRTGSKTCTKSTQLGANCELHRHSRRDSGGGGLRAELLALPKGCAMKKREALRTNSLLRSHASPAYGTTAWTSLESKTFDSACANRRGHIVVRLSPDEDASRLVRME